MPGRIPLESLAGIAWNPWPESNGITGRDHVESVAGIVWNLHKALSSDGNPEFGTILKVIKALGLVTIQPIFFSVSKKKFLTRFWVKF